MKFRVNSEDFNKHKDTVIGNVTKWSDKAVCRTIGVDSFYHIEENKLKQVAQQYCVSCPVQNQCLYTALIIKEDHGVWGGFTPRQRRALLKKLRVRALQKGYDFTIWNNKLASFIYKNTQIQKATEILSS